MRASSFFAPLTLVSLIVGNLSLQADDWVTLYNGKDLTGWKTTGNWFTEPGGVLAIKPRPGETGWKRYDAYLWAEKQYGDFVLDLEYKIPPKGNSGVFVRVGDLFQSVEFIVVADDHKLVRFRVVVAGDLLGQ